ncbi:hypothetical protein AcV7_003939 [Taiwanofungus camphoratus]|nr:hypothetical protein AcV7_003939 [Antrodia cinnamomea]
MLYREHEFYITCEGEKLEEYDIRLESEGTISCLIPSEAGKKFGIRCHAFGEMDAVVDYYVDGTYLHSGTLTKNCWYHVRGIQIDTATYRPLQFTNVIVTGTVASEL